MFLLRPGLSAQGWYPVTLVIAMRTWPALLVFVVGACGPHVDPPTPSVSYPPWPQPAPSRAEAKPFLGLPGLTQVAITQTYQGEIGGGGRNTRIEVRRGDQVVCEL